MIGLLHVVLLSSVALAQTVLQVNVGDNGLFFVPQTVDASAGDIVTFNFVGRNHSVTQSSEDAPCTPLEGGFNSGLLGVGNDTTAPPGVWNLTVTDDSRPIWYFCSAVSPASHCSNGMVGAINPPSNESFSSFQSLAKQLTVSVTAATDAIALTGIGSSASISPTTTATIPASTTKSASSSSSSNTNGPSPTVQSPNNGVKVQLAREWTTFVVLLSWAILAVSAIM